MWLSLYGCRGAVELVEFPRWKVKVTMLKDRKKGQRSNFHPLRLRGKTIKKKSGAFLVDFLPAAASVAT